MVVMMMVIGVISVVMTVIITIVMVMMVRMIVTVVMVVMMIAVPSCGWNRAADYDCANNAQRCSNCRQGSHDAFLHLVSSSFG